MKRLLLLVVIMCPVLAPAETLTIDTGTHSICEYLHYISVVFDVVVPLQSATIDSIDVVLSGSGVDAEMWCEGEGGSWGPIPCHLPLWFTFLDQRNLVGEQTRASAYREPFGNYAFRDTLRVMDYPYRGFGGGHHEGYDLPPGSLDGLMDGINNVELWSMDELPGTHCIPCEPVTCYEVDCVVLVHYSTLVSNESKSWSDVRKLYR